MLWQAVSCNANSSRLLDFFDQPKVLSAIEKKYQQKIRGLIHLYPF